MWMNRINSPVPGCRSGHCIWPLLGHTVVQVRHVCTAACRRPLQLLGRMEASLGFAAGKSLPEDVAYVLVSFVSLTETPNKNILEGKCVFGSWFQRSGSTVSWLRGRDMLVEGPGQGSCSEPAAQEQSGDSGGGARSTPVTGFPSG